MATIECAFDPKNNSLNAWRLILASGVILSHAYLFTGQHMPAEFFLGRGVWVDGFFAISGFLITGSWLHKPKTRTYFVARALRILPALWVCLIVTAFVFAPITGTVSLASQIRYVLVHATLLPFPPGIDGTPSNQFVIWNGSLWTLLFEALCYALVAILGIIGLLNRWFICAAFVATVAWALSLPPESSFAELIKSGQPITAEIFSLLVQAEAARLFMMFFAGALLYLLRDKVPANWPFLAMGIVLFVASLLLPIQDYRLAGAIPLAYVLITSGILIRARYLQLHTDLSYGVYIYGFPLQQLLLFAGVNVAALPFAALSLVVTLPMAALSWFLIEKPSLTLKARIVRRATTKFSAKNRESPPAPSQPWGEHPRETGAGGRVFKPSG